MPIRTLPTLWSEIRYSEKKNRLSVAIDTSQNSVRAVLKARAPRKTRRAVTTRGSSVDGTAWDTAVPAMPAAMVWSMVVRARKCNGNVSDARQRLNVSSKEKRKDAVISTGRARAAPLGPRGGGW